MNAYLSANVAVLDEMYDDLVALIRSLDDDCLNWAPPAPEANAIAPLVVHIAGSLHSWLARALAEPFERDRDAEFRARHGAADLLALVEQSRQRVREQFARLDAVDAGTARPVQRLQRGQEQAVSVAWCIAHALIHAGEHWGQIQFTHQLYAARHATS